MRHRRIHAFYQSQLTKMPDRWKKVLAIIKPIIFFDSHEIVLLVKYVQASIRYFYLPSKRLNLVFIGTE